MTLFNIDINEIVDLGTQVAANGTLRSMVVAPDELFEFIIAIVILVYEVNP